MGMKWESEIFQYMIDLSFESIHIVINSFLLFSYLCFKSFYITFLKLEKLGKTRWIHLNFRYYLAQMVRVHCWYTWPITNVGVLMIEVALVGVRSKRSKLALRSHISINININYYLIFGCLGIHFQILLHHSVDFHCRCI